MPFREWPPPKPGHSWQACLTVGISALHRLRAGRSLSVDHEIARDWHRITLGRKQQLKHHVRTVQEFEFHGSEIEFPHPTEPFVIDRRRTGTIFGEALAPMFNRVMIMQP